jgi:hypothetical protein
MIRWGLYLKKLAFSRNMNYYRAFFVPMLCVGTPTGRSHSPEPCAERSGVHGKGVNQPPAGFEPAGGLIQFNAVLQCASKLHSTFHNLSSQNKNPKANGYPPSDFCMLQENIV